MVTNRSSKHARSIKISTSSCLLLLAVKTLSLSTQLVESPGLTRVPVQCGIFGKGGQLGMILGGREQIGRWQFQVLICGSFASGYVIQIAGEMHEMQERSRHSFEKAC